MSYHPGDEIEDAPVGPIPAHAWYKTIENGKAIFLCERCQAHIYGLQAGEYLGEHHYLDPDANHKCEADDCCGEC